MNKYNPLPELFLDFADHSPASIITAPPSTMLIERLLKRHSPNSMVVVTRTSEHCNDLLNFLLRTNCFEGKSPSPHRQFRRMALALAQMGSLFIATPQP